MKKTFFGFLARLVRPKIPLVSEIYFSKLEDIRLAMQQRQSPDFSTLYSPTAYVHPLALACALGREECAKILLEGGANPNFVVRTPRLVSDPERRFAVPLNSAQLSTFGSTSSCPVGPGGGGGPFGPFADGYGFGNSNLSSHAQITQCSVKTGGEAYDGTPYARKFDCQSLESRYRHPNAPWLQCKMTPTSIAFLNGNCHLLQMLYLNGGRLRLSFRHPALILRALFLCPKARTAAICQLLAIYGDLNAKDVDSQREFVRLVVLLKKSSTQPSECGFDPRGGTGVAVGGAGEIQMHEFEGMVESLVEFGFRFNQDQIGTGILGIHSTPNHPVEEGAAARTRTRTRRRRMTQTRRSQSTFRLRETPAKRKSIHRVGSGLKYSRDRLRGRWGGEDEGRDEREVEVFEEEDHRSPRPPSSSSSVHHHSAEESQGGQGTEIADVADLFSDSSIRLRTVLGLENRFRSNSSRRRMIAQKKYMSVRRMSKAAEEEEDAAAEARQQFRERDRRDLSRSRRKPPPSRRQSEMPSRRRIKDIRTEVRSTDPRRSSSFRHQTQQQQLLLEQSSSSDSSPVDLSRDGSCSCTTPVDGNLLVGSVPQQQHDDAEVPVSRIPHRSATVLNLRPDAPSPEDLKTRRKSAVGPRPSRPQERSRKSRNQRNPRKQRRNRTRGSGTKKRKMRDTRSRTPATRPLGGRRSIRRRKNRQRQRAQSAHPSRLTEDDFIGGERKRSSRAKKKKVRSRKPSHAPRLEQTVVRKKKTTPRRPQRVSSRKKMREESSHDEASPARAVLPKKTAASSSSRNLTRRRNSFSGHQGDRRLSEFGQQLPTKELARVASKMLPARKELPPIETSPVISRRSSKSHVPQAVRMRRKSLALIAEDLTQRRVPRDSTEQYIEELGVSEKKKPGVRNFVRRFTETLQSRVLANAATRKNVVRNCENEHGLDEVLVHSSGGGGSSKEMEEFITQLYRMDEKITQGHCVPITSPETIQTPVGSNALGIFALERRPKKKVSFVVEDDRDVSSPVRTSSSLAVEMRRGYLKKRRMLGERNRRRSVCPATFLQEAAGLRRHAKRRSAKEMFAPSSGDELALTTSRFEAQVRILFKQKFDVWPNECKASIVQGFSPRGGPTHDTIVVSNLSDADRILVWLSFVCLNAEGNGVVRKMLKGTVEREGDLKYDYDSPRQFLPDTGAAVIFLAVQHLEEGEEVRNDDFRNSEECPDGRLTSKFYWMRRFLPAKYDPGQKKLTCHGGNLSNLRDSSDGC